MSKQKAKGYISDRNEPYYPVVVVTCPVCEYDTTEKRHNLKVRTPYSCSYCGILFEVREWNKEEVGE